MQFQHHYLKSQSKTLQFQVSIAARFLKHLNQLVSSLTIHTCTVYVCTSNQTLFQTTSLDVQLEYNKLGVKYSSVLFSDQDNRLILTLESENLTWYI